MTLSSKNSRCSSDEAKYPVQIVGVVGMSLNRASFIVSYEGLKDRCVNLVTQRYF